MTRDPRPIGRLLTPAGARGERDLAAILDQAKWLKSMELQICECLPPVLRQHIAVANIRGDTLVMRADSAAWGTRLRYLRSQVIAQAIRVGLEISRLDIRVSPRQRAQPPARKPYPISENAARSIAETASGVEDTELAAALIRLARTARKNNSE